MSGERRKFKRATAEERREALITATLALVAEKGVRGATVRDIADRADVTQGLIRHYFSSKEELMTAAYEHHMVFISDLTFAPVAGMEGDAHRRLAGFVEASLSPPVVEPTAVALWAGFLNKVQQDPQMRQIHQRTYDYFRDKLAELIAAALAEVGRPVDPARLHHLAVACNAVIDGLWMEGGALPEAFEEGELPAIGLESVGAILGMNLQQKAEQP
ncbi:TetR/AcrR family transcriptional regulator [Phaeobacter porticola]|uniref:Putative transcriptional regulator, TetR family n=1 Tax=Phaeobacter porticola TaxID=1844006 RepID=A0A1L3IAB6_9RHOB|nr:TetR family transcriptional regulator C-terminal domain-containing protein [Phaeobacter porticola]APG49110.1 putative transcriptional regulator, TetR family [Phaeobacter porticola]